MLKKTIIYTDYNNEKQQEDLYFNLTRTEIIDLIDLQPRLEAWQKMLSGEERDLTTEEVRELLSLIKLLIEKSYGVRSEDGRRFMKSDDLFTEFKQTAVYDEFVFGLFRNGGTAAIEFLTGIVPADLLDNEPESTTKTVELPQPSHDDIPAWVREDREPTPKELTSMSQDQLRDAFMKRSQMRKEA